MGKRRQLTYEQHVSIGLRLKEAREQLMISWIEICAGAGKTSRSCKLIQRTAKDLEALRCELDSTLFRDSPDGNVDKLKRVYYGPSDETP